MKEIAIAYKIKELDFDKINKKIEDKNVSKVLKAMFDDIGYESVCQFEIKKYYTYSLYNIRVTEEEYMREFKYANVYPFPVLFLNNSPYRILNIVLCYCKKGDIGCQH